MSLPHLQELEALIAKAGQNPGLGAGLQAALRALHPQVAAIPAATLVYQRKLFGKAHAAVQAVADGNGSAIDVRNATAALACVAPIVGIAARTTFPDDRRSVTTDFMLVDAATCLLSASVAYLQGLPA